MKRHSGFGSFSVNTRPVHSAWDGACTSAYTGGHASRRRRTPTPAKPRKSAYLPRAHQEHLSLSLALEGTSHSSATSAETIASFVRTCRGECDGMFCGDPVKQCWSEKMGTVNLTSVLEGRKKKTRLCYWPSFSYCIFLVLSALRSP